MNISKAAISTRFKKNTENKQTISKQVKNKQKAGRKQSLIDDVHDSSCSDKHSKRLGVTV